MDPVSSFRSQSSSSGMIEVVAVSTGGVLGAGSADPVWDAVTLALGLSVLVGVPEPVGLPLPVGLPVPEGVVLGSETPVSLGVGAGDPESLGVGTVSVGDGLGVSVGGMEGAVGRGGVRSMIPMLGVGDGLPLRNCSGSTY